jgi:hypothetical protein
VFGRVKNAQVFQRLAVACKCCGQCAHGPHTTCLGVMQIHMLSLQRRQHQAAAVSCCAVRQVARCRAPAAEAPLCE